ncbi:aminotransferase class V-fold PLP-dependent enzyme [Cereibacter azotoformans]|uniref:cysteine desulfurase family protein n=1 Tax=Cereibacter azotoformans TaxID=43057 RepID=UPI000E35EC1C|nr:aminotransferase class V-fold PLP-dependent enzyme [Cereibacter azotoformans]AXQ94240.1 aminotransferase class V-fold PLP-dependent enzyme [Cereibacter sphaeroides]UIJ29781.1 aminotransferase class V-fold PLP-dependent enzyme [Cereibacter azotoformans]
MRSRIYLDWNATAPLRPEARAAMASAMDLVGNPSSVHAEGRAAKALMERARAQVTAALGADGADVVFVSGATEAAALACAGRGLLCAEVEHEAVSAWCHSSLPVDGDGRVRVDDPARTALQMANSETGILQDLPEGLAVSDLTQAFGKVPFAFNWLGCAMGFVSAHKIGGPKGVGALVIRRGLDLEARLKGGGQEMGRRAGTENLIGIAGFGAAAEAAARDLAAGAWESVLQLRNILELSLCEDGKGTISVGKAARRLPNTLCLVTPGWKGETQVMQMDLAGFAVSAGSACSSGKVRASRVLRAMGLDETSAASALRVSIGPGVTEAEVMRFAEAWLRARDRHRARAA